MAVDGNYLYASAVNSVEVIDVSDPAVPQRIGSYYLGSGGKLSFADERLCVIEDYNQLSCLPRQCPAPSKVEIPVASRMRLKAWPNPGRAEVAVEIVTPRAVAGMLRIYDVAGRRVGEIDAGRLPAGSHFLRWDGRDRAGLPVPSGVYLVRLDLLLELHRWDVPDRPQQSSGVEPACAGRSNGRWGAEVLA